MDLRTRDPNSDTNFPQPAGHGQPRRLHEHPRRTGKIPHRGAFPALTVAMSVVGSIIISTLAGGIAAVAIGAIGRVGAPPQGNRDPLERPEALARARELRAAHDRRLGTLLVTFGILIWPVGIILTAAAEANGYSINITFGVVLTSAALLMRGRRMRTKGAEQVRQGDPRPPIVYLRPFTIDKSNREAIRNDALWATTPEQRIARSTRNIAPFIALGDPIENLPELGPNPIYTDDAEWQRTVETLTPQAGTIILYTGTSRGLAWEVRHVVGLGKPERTVLWRGRLHDYEVFRREFCDVFPSGLLDASLSTEFMYFDADWTPRSFDRHARIEASPGSPGEQRALVLHRLSKQQRNRAVIQGVTLGGCLLVFLLAAILMASMFIHL